MTPRWHALLSLFACLALVAPTLFVFRNVREARAASVVSEDGVLPVLSAEVRAQLPTYRRSCLRRTDCDPPLACFFDTRHGNYCTDSACIADSQCGEGQTCRTLTTPREGPRVRLCAPIGPRIEGQHCLNLTRDRISSCTADLQCVGMSGFSVCARTCVPGEPGTCPDGFFCSDAKPEPTCRPTCEARGCPQDQTCIPFGDKGVSLCAAVYGRNCVETPCPDGRKCEISPDPRYPGKVWMECVQRCSDTNRT
ncbi:MAG: hypothetical protein EOO72_08985, partial [Myxococcaceae bacterium]